MNVDNERMDYEAAGSLAEELPWWGWLEDGRTCLTRAGEFMSIGRLTPSVLDGQTSEQLDRVIDRWQRMLSGLDPRTRLYFYLLRRPVHFADDSAGAPSSVAALGRRKRRVFSGRTSAGRERLRGLVPRSAPILQLLATKEQGRAVVEGHCQELDGAAAQPATCLSIWTRRSSQRQPASGSWLRRAGRSSMTSRRCGCLKRGRRRSF